MRARPAKRKGPTHGRRRWSPPTSAPAIAASAPADPAAGRAVPRPVRRGHPQAHVPDHRRRTAASSACGPTSPSRCRATTSPRPPPARPQGFCYLGPVFRTAARCRPNSCRPASSRSAAPTRPRPTPRCWRSASRPPRITASPRRKSGWATSALFAALIAGARSGAGLEAAAGQGLQPQGHPRAGPRPR